jgi:membrane fusion protein (multidrug efflux system)
VVEVDTVKTGRIVETREAVGTVRAFESITVGARVAGIVDKIEFQEGQKVKAGDLLVSLDALERRADIEAAVAESRRASAQRNEVATRLDRAQALRRTGAGTEAQVDDLTAQVRTLESAIASAEARRRAAEARLEDLVIRAPFAGRVGTRSVSLGAYVAPGTRITTLDDLSKIRLDFSMPENLLGRLKEGQVVRAKAAAYRDRAFEGKVSIIDPRVDPVTRTARLTAEFPNPDEALKPGMFLSVGLEVTANDNAVVVAEEAVVSEGLRHVVYPVKDNKVERRVIRIGQRQNGKVEVLEGLQAGETIVVLGLQRVRPGATVSPRPVGAQPSPPPAARREPGTQPGAQPARSALNPVNTANAAERN